MKQTTWPEQSTQQVLILEMEEDCRTMVDLTTGKTSTRLSEVPTKQKAPIF